MAYRRGFSSRMPTRSSCMAASEPACVRTNAASDTRVQLLVTRIAIHERTSGSAKQELTGWRQMSAAAAASFVGCMACCQHCHPQRAGDQERPRLQSGARTRRRRSPSTCKAPGAAWRRQRPPRLRCLPRLPLAAPRLNPVPCRAASVMGHASMSALARSGRTRRPGATRLETGWRSALCAAR
jgi:hypothetical protein